MRKNVIAGGGESELVAINKRLINSIVPPEKGSDRLILWDSQVKGFGLRVYASGRIVYVLQYRMKEAGAKTRTSTIGTHGSPWTPEGARERAKDLLEQVRRGVDPEAERKAAESLALKAEAAAFEAAGVAVYYDFDAFADRYIERHVKAEKLRSLKDIEGTFDRELRPWFKGKSVLEITKQDVKDMRSHVGANSQSAANKAHKWLNAAFMWGVEHDGLETSPMIALKKPYKEPQRDRVLKDWELALIWSVLPSANWRFAMLDRLLIMTGCRLREVSGAHWEEFNLVKAEWVIPGTRTKNKRQHLVPLTPQMIRMLEAIQPDPDQRRGLVLTTNGRTPISGFSKSKAALDAAVDAAHADPRWQRFGPMQGWVRHDYRRTFSTGCGELSIPIAHAEAVLNHVSGTLGGVARTYWLYKYAPEKRSALIKWNKRLDKILAGHKVATL